MVRPEDDVVVEVLELRDGLTLKALWDAGITCGFEAGPLKAVQASEVWLPRLPGIDLVPKFVKYLGRTVPRGIGCERRSFRWWLVDALAHIRSGWMDSRCEDVPWAGSELATLVAALAQNDHGFHRAHHEHRTATQRLWQL